MFITRKIMLLLFALIFGVGTGYAQEDDTEEEPVRKSNKKFLSGLYVGSYFANKYSASTYNGYGFDVNGNRNTFVNSFMYQKIVNEYGYGRGLYDYVAEALGVDQGQWDFKEDDMPTNMRYLPAIMVGFNARVKVDNTSAIIFNINGSKINLEGNFTITTRKPPSASPLNNNNLQIFPIKGSEQRLLFQLGFQKLLGGDEKLNFLVEAGFNATLAKYDKNYIYINNLQIDLTYYVNQTLYTAPPPTRRPIGLGIGAFGGLGVHLAASARFTIQILYSPSFEKVNIGTAPTLKLQNAAGLRAYYNF